MSNLIIVLGALVVALFFRVFIISVYKIPTPSMSPTFLPGDFIMASQVSYGLKFPWSEDVWFASKPQVGDLIVFKFKKKPTITYIKRIFAIDGEEFKLADGTAQKIPVGEVAVMNDNTDVTDDSREQGFVALADINSQAKSIWFSYSKESGVRWSRLLTAPAAR